MDFTFPFEITPIVTWTIWKLQISLSCEFRVSEIIEQRQALPPDYFHLDFCAATPSIWWDGIYCLWDWWKITRVFSPSIRKSNVALMLWYGEKSDLALGSGMFLVRLWWVGPGRGHMKGSLCQAAKMFSLSLMKTRTHIQIGEHACHTLYKHQGYNIVDSHGLLSLFFKGGQSEKHVCSVIKRQQDTEAKLTDQRQTIFFSLPFFLFLCGSTGNLISWIQCLENASSQYILDKIWWAGVVQRARCRTVFINSSQIVRYFCAISCETMQKLSNSLNSVMFIFVDTLAERCWFRVIWWYLQQRYSMLDC